MDHSTGRRRLIQPEKVSLPLKSKHNGSQLTGLLVIKNERHGRAADIFSLGCVLFEILYVMCKVLDEPSILSKFRSRARGKSYSDITGEMHSLLQSMKLPSFFPREDHECFLEVKRTISSMLNNEQQLRPHAADLKFPHSWYCECCPPLSGDTEVCNTQTASGATLSSRGTTLLPPDNGLPLRASLSVSASSTSVSTSTSTNTTGDSDDTDHIPGSPETGVTTINPEAGLPGSGKPLIKVIPPAISGNEGSEGTHTNQGVDNEIVYIDCYLSEDDPWCLLGPDTSIDSHVQTRVQRIRKLDSLINPGSSPHSQLVDLSDEQLEELEASVR